MVFGRSLVLKGHTPVCENIYLFGNYEMDIMSVNKSGMVLEYEVKISRSDFKVDAKKRKFKVFSREFEKRMPNYFSYVCPSGLINVDEIPEYAGLYYVNGEIIKEVKKPKRLHIKLHSKSLILAKVCRIYSERHFLGVCKLTYENKYKP
jgi:hypothetical protein